MLGIANPHCNIPPIPIANEPINRGDKVGAKVAAVPVVPHNSEAKITAKIPRY